MEITQEKKTEIYEAYNKKVLSYVRGKVNDQYMAEDICSDVFIKVFEKLDTFDESKASLSTWIYTIARNKVIDFYRKNKLTEEVPEDMTTDDDILEDMCEKEDLQLLANALERLDDREKHIIIGHYYHNKKLKDLAEELNISYSYIKLLHNETLKKLKKYI